MMQSDCPILGVLLALWEEKFLPVVSYRKPRDVGVGVQSLAAASYSWLSEQMMLCILAALMPGF